MPAIPRHAPPNPNPTTKILSVMVEGVAYRCEETNQPSQDLRGEPMRVVTRSKWLSREGKEISDQRAEDALKIQQEKDEEEALRIRLWPPGHRDVL